MDATEYTIRYRLPLFAEEFPYLVLWSEKSGCTSVVKWFFWHLGVLDDALRYSRWVHDYEQRVFKTKAGYKNQCSKALKDDKWPKIKFIRNPAIRAVSSFLSLSGRAANEKPGHVTNVLWKQMREYFYRDPYDERGVSFNMYCDFLEKRGASVGIVDGHFAAQVVPGEQELPISYFRLDSILNAVPILENLSGKERSPIRELNKSSHHRALEVKASPDGCYTADSIITETTFYRRSVPDYSAFLTADIRGQLEKLFPGDFSAWRSAL